MSTALTPPRQKGSRLSLKPVDRQAARIFIMGLQALIFFISIFSLAAAPPDIDNDYLNFTMVLAVSLLALQGFHRATNPNKATWLSIEILSMLAFIVVHFAFIFYWVMDWFPAELEPKMFEAHRAGNTRDQVCRASMFSVAVLAIFAIGYNLLPDRFSQVSKQIKFDRENLVRWRTAGLVAMLFAVASGLLIVAMLGRGAFTGMYKGTDTGSRGLNYLMLLSTTTMMSGMAMFTLASFQLRKSIVGLGILGPLLIIGYTLAFLVHGDRDVTFLTVFVLAVAYTERIRRIPFVVLPAILIVGIIAYAFAGAARISSERTIQSYFGRMYQVREKLPLDSGLLELAMQVRQLYVAMSYFPDKRDFGHGRFMLPPMISSIPMANRLLLTHLWLKSSGTHEQNSSHFLTWVKIYRAGNYGAGTTSVADSYIDFGYSGAIIMHLFMGILAKFVEQKSRSSGSIVFGAALCFLVPGLSVAARSVVVGPLIRGVMWPILIIIFFRVLFGIGSSIIRSPSTRSPLFLSPSLSTLPKTSSR